MRIIAGKYKGHPLVSFEASHIRPTTDRVKEALFNILQFDISADTKVADCFSGTGNLGIEALSRGAQHVTFIDAHTKSIQILKSNLQKLKIESQDYHIKKMDIYSFLDSDLTTYHLFLIDPPFTKKMAHQVMQTLSTKTLMDGALIAIESAASETIADEYLGLALHKRREFGDKILSIFLKA
jgi:16S rRNA (guanine966-N2)-methyltransferase